MLNSVSIQGRLARDPELRKTQSGLSVCSISLAVERDFADKASGKREADFLNVVAWRNTADFIANYFLKGDMMVVCGRLQARSYTDRDGNKRTATEVLAESAYFCGSKPRRDESIAPPPYSDMPNNDGDEEELPF